MGISVCRAAAQGAALFFNFALFRHAVTPPHPSRQLRRAPRGKQKKASSAPPCSARYLPFLAPVLHHAREAGPFYLRRPILTFLLLCLCSASFQPWPPLLCSLCRLSPEPFPPPVTCPGQRRRCKALWSGTVRARVAHPHLPPQQRSRLSVPGELAITKAYRMAFPVPYTFHFLWRQPCATYFPAPSSRPCSR